MIDGRGYVLESPIQADFALIKAERADRWGNLVYRKTARNFGPVMATAAKLSVAEVRAFTDEPIAHDKVQLPGLYVDRVVTAP